MNKQQMASIGRLGGKFYFKHFRDGKLIDEGKTHNKFIDEGLIYALNCAFGASIGGSPTPIPQVYLGLGKANRVWQGTEVAATINTVADEFQLYSEVGRPNWNPQTLASTGNIELSDSGFEATFTLTADVNIYSGFLISSSTKDGAGDASAVLVAGANFPDVRVLLNGDIFKVGYVLKNESKV